MIKRFSTNFAILCAILDGLLVIIALAFANSLRPFFTSHITALANVQAPAVINPAISVFSALVWVVVLIQLGVYAPEKNYRIVDEVYNLLLGAIISLTIISGFLYIINSQISRFLFFTFGVITYVMHLIHRLIYRSLIKHKLDKTKNKQRLLIVGAGVIGRRFEKEINGYSELGYNLVGFLDDNPELISSHEDVLGRTDEIKGFIEKHDIDDLIIALPHRAHQRMNELVQEVHTLPVRVWVIPDYFALMLSSASVENFAGLPMINLRAPALTNKQRIAKRILDLVYTVPLFFLLLPFFALIALLIKLDSGGPVFYRSTRLKENGENFEMLKFRTMVPNAHALLSKVIKRDENGHIIYKRPDDPRVTKVGKFLRKTSLDELPQLINILKGDMSLIGPRPELPEMAKLYKPWQYKRFSVPQGLTGWWQIHGRSDKPMHLHTEEDLYYIQNYSIWIDLQILIKTVLIVLRGKGAY